MKPQERKKIDKLILDIVVLKERAMRLGMFKTGHALEEGVTAVGRELAEKLEVKDDN